MAKRWGETEEQAITTFHTKISPHRKRIAMDYDYSNRIGNIIIANAEDDAINARVCLARIICPLSFTGAAGLSSYYLFDKQSNIMVHNSTFVWLIYFFMLSDIMSGATMGFIESYRMRILQVIRTGGKIKYSSSWLNASYISHFISTITASSSVILTFLKATGAM
jgi:hypothetical protein